MVFIPSRFGRLYAGNLQFDLHLIEVHDGFVCLADLEIFTDHPCDLLPREKAFLFLYIFLLNEDSSFEFFFDDLLETTRYFWSQDPRSVSTTCSDQSHS